MIAGSFARIFQRNSFNMGLPIFVSIEASRDIQSGDVIEVDPDRGIIFNRTTGKEYASNPLPEFIQELVTDGGLIEHIKKRGKI